MSPEPPTEARLVLSQVRVTLSDAHDPTFGQPPGGSLFQTHSAVRGTAETSFSVSDKGGGVYQAALIVDGHEQNRSVIDPTGACVEPFRLAVPCPSSVQSSLSLDTTEFPDGLHTVSVVIYDVTGINKVISDPVQIQVENFSPAGHLTGSSARQPNGVGATAKARLVGIGRSGRPTRWAKDGKTSTVIGRLIDEAGKPITGAALAAFAAVDVPGAKEKLIAGATTDKTGKFRLIVPKGPSRRISVRYQAFSDDQKAVTWSFRVNVAAPIKLLASRERLRNGDKLTLTAYLAGRKVPKGSTDIAFQVRIGKQWRTFAKQTLGAKGIARVGHRFRVTYHRMTYRFRAVTLKRRTFPYADARSAPVAVRVN